jgi:AbrB family looped-hinge helix DNA binding protein
MKSTKVTVSNRGYIVLPASLRKEMEIKPGTKMLLKKDKDKLILETVPSFTKKLAGLTAKTIAKTPEDVKAYIDVEREDRNVATLGKI